jgi:hypothetical protein
VNPSRLHMPPGRLTQKTGATPTAYCESACIAEVASIIRVAYQPGRCNRRHAVHRKQLRSGPAKQRAQERLDIPYTLRHREQDVLDGKVHLVDECVNHRVRGPCAALRICSRVPPELGQWDAPLDRGAKQHCEAD